MAVNKDLLSFTPSSATLIGQGSTANVYKGKYGKDNVAIKQFFRANEADREIAVLEELGTSAPKFVVNYYGKLHGDDGKLCLVFEYMPHTLSSILHKKCSPDKYEDIGGIQRLKFNLKLKWATQASQGLADIHEAGKMHRDIKPLNLLADSDFNLKYCDFGVARDVTEQFGGTSANSLSMASMNSLSDSAAKQVRGTLPYLAPELLTVDHVYSEMSDLWALAVTIIEIFSEELPYSDIPGTCVAFGEMAIHRAIMEGRTPTMSFLNFYKDTRYELFSQQIGDIVSRMIDVDPGSRCSVREAADVFTELLNSLISPPTTVTRTITAMDKLEVRIRECTVAVSEAKGRLVGLQKAYSDKRINIVESLGEEPITSMEKDELFKNGVKSEEFTTKYMKNTPPGIAKLADLRKQEIAILDELASLETNLATLIDDKSHNDLLPCDLYQLLTTLQTKQHEENASLKATVIALTADLEIANNRTLQVQSVCLERINAVEAACSARVDNLLAILYKTVASHESQLYELIMFKSNIEQAEQKRQADIMREQQLQRQIEEEELHKREHDRLLADVERQKRIDDEVAQRELAVSSFINFTKLHLKMTWIGNKLVSSSPQGNCFAVAGTFLPTNRRLFWTVDIVALGGSKWIFLGVTGEFTHVGASANLQLWKSPSSSGWGSGNSEVYVNGIETASSGGWEGGWVDGDIAVFMWDPINCVLVTMRNRNSNYRHFRINTATNSLQLAVNYGWGNSTVVVRAATTVERNQLLGGM